MSAPDDESTDSSALIEQALSESQRQERAELHDQLSRQLAADQRVVDALAAKDPE